MNDFLIVQTFGCFSAGEELSSCPIAELGIRWTLGSSWFPPSLPASAPSEYYATLLFVDVGLIDAGATSNKQQARVVPATWRVPGGSIGDCYSYRTSIVYDQAGE